MITAIIVVLFLIVIIYFASKFWTYLHGEKRACGKTGYEFV